MGDDAAKLTVVDNAELSATKPNSRAVGWAYCLPTAERHAGHVPRRGRPRGRGRGIASAMATAAFDDVRARGLTIVASCPSSSRSSSAIPSTTRLWPTAKRPPSDPRAVARGCRERLGLPVELDHFFARAGTGHQADVAAGEAEGVARAARVASVAPPSTRVQPPSPSARCRGPAAHSPGGGRRVGRAR